MSEARIEAYKEKVSDADGTLISLKKLTSEGKRLYIAARYLRAPGKNGLHIAGSVNPDFYLWESRDAATGVLLVDVYMSEGRKRLPLGHMDWWLQIDYANGGGNMHDAALPRNEYERLAGRTWHKYDYTAFKVDYDYHRQGIGSLLVATSAVVLPVIGISKFYTGAILEPARRTYARFGVRYDDFPNVRAQNRSLPIDRLSDHPQVNRTISEFVD